MNKQMQILEKHKGKKWNANKHIHITQSMDLLLSSCVHHTP